MGSHTIELANSLSDHWASWMEAAVVDSICLLLAMAAIWWLIRRRVAPNIGYALFLLVPLRLLSPIAIGVPHGMASWLPSQIAARWLNAGDKAPSALAKTEAAQPAVDTAQPLVDSASPQMHGESRPSREPQPFLPEATAPVAATTEPVAIVPPPTIHSTTIAMAVWLVVALLLVVRLVLAQGELRRWLRRAAEIDNPRLRELLRSLCQQAAIRKNVRLVESDRVAAPAAWGLFRPTIIVPPDFCASLGEKQLRWMLLHELAHLKRHDLPVMLLQRIAAILNFFNPAVWIANRAANRLREYACDDFATLVGASSGVEASEAFMQTLQNAFRTRQKLQGALGIFGLDSRGTCFARMRRMLDTDRPMQARAGWPSIVALAIVALVALPHLYATAEGGATLNPPNAARQAALPSEANQKPASGDQSPTANKKSAPAAAGTKDPSNELQVFTLTVVGPDKKPLPGITVTCRANPRLKPEDFLIGKITRQTEFVRFVKLDEHGRLQLRLPKNPMSLDIDIEAPGFGPYWAEWNSRNHPESIPAEFVAELDPAWSVGGVVVDDDGKPIEGVAACPSMEMKKRPGDSEQMAWFGEAKTNAKGEWHYDSIPVSKKDVPVQFEHPKFAPAYLNLARSDYEVKPGTVPTEKITLPRGITVTGTVTDDQGRPVAGAHVRTQRDVLNFRDVTTGANGKYELHGFQVFRTGLVNAQVLPAQIFVTAKGHAPDFRDLTALSLLGPVDFRLKPGNRMRVRVLDPQGRPVAHAQIYFEQWREPIDEKDLGEERHFTDAHGVWQWDDAPADEMKAEIAGDGTCMSLMYQPLMARKQEYVFHLLPLLVVSGKVVDAETKKPIESFRVNQAIVSDSKLVWLHGNSFKGTDGRFQIRQDHQYDGFVFKIEADGYKPATSRTLKSDEGNVSLDFELHKR